MDDNQGDAGLGVVATFESEPEAAVIGSVLEEAGIPSQLLGGHLQAVGAMLPGPRVQLAVHKADLPRAFEVLEAMALRMEQRELALDDEGRCAACGHDMSDRPGQELCRACGVNLRDLATRLRSHRLIEGVPTGSARVSGPVGRWVARGALVFIGIPCVVIVAMLFTSNPVVLTIGIGLVLMVVLVLGARREVT